MRGLFAALVVLACVWPSVASAQRDGVRVDPDSPAGTEYAIPLEKARRDAAGETGARRAAGDQPLFGVGVEPATASAGGGADGGTRPRADGGDGPSRDPEPRSTARSKQRSAALQAVAADGGSGLGTTTGIAAAVLAAAAAAGFALRRLLSSDSK